MRARLAIAASGISVELREVVFRDKPVELLAASAKATVPVLIDGKQVIDESYDIMLWALYQNDPEGWLDGHDETLIAQCDGAFKSALDRYKYADGDVLDARDAAGIFVRKLDEKLGETPYLSGQNFGMTDASIVPFIRQFANVNRKWFNAEPYSNLHNWLGVFLTSERFDAIMYKYPKWQKNTPETLFPEPT